MTQNSEIFFQKSDHWVSVSNFSVPDRPSDMMLPYLPPPPPPPSYRGTCLITIFRRSVNQTRQDRRVRKHNTQQSYRRRWRLL